MINYANESIQQFCLERVVKEDGAQNYFNHVDVIGKF